MDTQKQGPSVTRGLHDVLKERMEKFLKETSADELVKKLEDQGVKFVDISNKLFNAVDNVFEQYKKKHYIIRVQSTQKLIPDIYVYGNQQEVDEYMEKLTTSDVYTITQSEIQIKHL